jgi:hypothetical protein
MATAVAMPIHGAPESGPACEPERDDGQELGLAVALQAFQLVREMPDEARTQVTAFLHQMAGAGLVTAETRLDDGDVVLTLRASATR